MGLDLTTAQAAWHPLLEISNVVRETTPATVQWSLDSADLRDADSYGDARGLGYDANSANVPTATTSVYGRASAAMQLNGTTDRLEADAALAVLGDDVTGGIALWCKPDDGVAFGGHTLIAMGDTNAHAVILLKITSTGIVLASCKGAGAAAWTFYKTAAVFTDGPQSWTHIALVQDGSGPALYINGSRIPSADCTWTTGEGAAGWLADVPGVDNVRIGCENYNSVADAEFFDGAICDVRVYTGAPTAQTINRLGAGTTLRYSDVDLALSDGTLYEGRIAAFSPLRQDLGRLLEAQFVLPELSISLRNTDDAISTLLDINNNFVGLACVLKMGQGTTATDYEVKFTGEVRYPDGVTQDDERVSLTFTDALESDNAIMPASKIFPAAYPRAELRSRFLPIPEVLGDWRSTAGGGEMVPGFCVDTAISEAGSAYVALWTLRASKMEDATTFSDSSGNGYHATSGGGAPAFLTSHAGIASGAMDLDGSTDYLKPTRP